MKTFSLLTLLALFVGLSSCLPEASLTLAPEIPEIVETPTVETNFQVNGNSLQIDHGYLFTLSEDVVGRRQHHLVLANRDVREDGAFSGSSEAITITIATEDTGDLSGEYVLEGSADDESVASAGRYYQRLRFNQTTNYEQGYFNEGSVLISRQGEEYIISLFLSTSFGGTELKGTFQGILPEIDLTESEPVDETLLQGPNNLKYGESEVELNHAYLVQRTNISSGPRQYRLYLSENEIAPDAATLTGRSDLIFFYVSEGAISEGGQFTLATSEYDYLSKFRKQVDTGYYCKNMDFTRNTADEDVPVPKGQLTIKDEDGEIVVAFSAETNAGTTTSGLYRGTMIRID
ncbi:hypothetical protein [Neolewinella persica]|uniref:hypothetical protein n=1 Tax=Neolewinella persica TaxID=70998 RepID=UPI00036A11A7|nr:hypothetical protein [Neolewinella persica]